MFKQWKISKFWVNYPFQSRLDRLTVVVYGMRTVAHWWLTKHTGLFLFIEGVVPLHRFGQSSPLNPIILSAFSLPLPTSVPRLGKQGKWLYGRIDNTLAIPDTRFWVWKGCLYCNLTRSCCFTESTGERSHVSIIQVWAEDRSVCYQSLFFKDLNLLIFHSFPLSFRMSLMFGKARTCNIVTVPEHEPSECNIVILGALGSGKSGMVLSITIYF